MSEFADPRTVRSILAARKAGARAVGKWESEDDDDPAAECEQLSLDAIDHLDEGRWDEACACAEATANLAEEHEQGALWREFVLLVEEAAETGRGAEG